MKIKISKRIAWTVVILAASIEIVIILALIYVSHKNTPGNVILENVLSTKISSSHDVVSLKHDLFLTNEALLQEHRDMSIETNGIKHWTVLDSSDKVLSGDKAVEQVIQEQLSAAIYLSSSNRKSLSVKASSIRNNYLQLIAMLTRVSILKSADDQQAAEQIMASLKSELSTAIKTSGKSGLTVADLDADLTTFDSDIIAGKKLSSGVETEVITTPPSKLIKLGYQEAIGTAQLDCSAALNAAKSIIGILSN